MRSEVMHAWRGRVALATGLVPVQEVQLSLAWLSRALHGKAMGSILHGRQHSLLLGSWNLVMYVLTSLP